MQLSDEFVCKLLPDNDLVAECLRRGMTVIDDRAFKFKRGQPVFKMTGDYQFNGWVIQPYYKRNLSTVRYIVEDDRGLNLIMSEGQIGNLEKIVPVPPRARRSFPMPGDPDYHSSGGHGA